MTPEEAVEKLSKEWSHGNQGPIFLGVHYMKAVAECLRLAKAFLELEKWVKSFDGGLFVSNIQDKIEELKNPQQPKTDDWRDKLRTLRLEILSRSEENRYSYPGRRNFTLADIVFLIDHMLEEK